MELRQLECILQISEDKNITKAAKKLYITQSALNQTLLKLEKEIGEPLFERTKIGLKANEIGEIYIEQAKKILDIRKETYERINEIKKIYNNTLKIGLTPERGMQMFLSIYPIFHNLYPNVKVEPFEANVEEQHTMLAAGKLDIAFVNVTEDQKTKNIYDLIRKEKLLLAVPVKFLKNLNNEDINIVLEHIKNKNFVMLPSNTTIRKVLNQYFEKKISSFLKILFESKNSSILIKMVENELACTIISEIHKIESKKIKYFPLENIYDLDYSVSYKKGKFLTTPTKKFIKLAKEYWNK